MIAKATGGAAGGAADDLRDRIGGCRICADRFAATATAHAPRPVVWFRPGARLMIASQAPGLRVHAAGTPFWDRSGVRLRDWLGLDEAAFYDRSRVAIVPMAFCFPGYDAAGIRPAAAAGLCRDVARRGDDRHWDRCALRCSLAVRRSDGIWGRGRA